MTEDVNRDFFLHVIPTAASENDIKEALKVYYIGVDRKFVLQFAIFLLIN